MQYKTGQIDDRIKPYSKARCKPNASNTQIDVEYQVKLYADWAKKKGLMTIHIFPAGNPGNARKTYDKLLRQDLDPDTKLVEVNPEDWKCG
jgi:hypothetical protein